MKTIKPLIAILEYEAFSDFFLKKVVKLKFWVSLRATGCVFSIWHYFVLSKKNP